MPESWVTQVADLSEKEEGFSAPTLPGCVTEVRYSASA